MTAHPWLAKFVESGHVRALIERSGRADRTIARGTRGSATALLAGALAAQSERTVLLVVAHLDEADDALDDLELFAAAGIPGDGLKVERFGAMEVLPGESAVSLELLAERLGVVDRLVKGDAPDLIVAPIQALMQSVPEPEALQRFGLTLASGGQISQGDLLAWLDRAGYQRTDAIEQPGDFAVRGGIVDVFAPAGSFRNSDGNEVTDAASSTSGGGGAVRLDFFGNEIETIHLVDPDTLGSRQKLASVRLIGADAKTILSDTGSTNLLQLLPNALPVLHEVMELSEQARGYYERLTNPQGVFSPREIFAQLAQLAHIQLNEYSATRPDDTILDLPFEALPNFHADAHEALRELSELTDDANNQVIVICQKPAERDRLRELLTEHAPQSIDRISMEVGYLHRGFVWRDDSSDPSSPAAPQGAASAPSAIRHSGGPPSAIFLIPHHELFHRYEIRRRVRRITAPGSSDKDAFLDLAAGDYVVHVDHGIALFTGLKTLRRKDETAEYLTLQFADKALLHVPATQIDLVQKYVGGFQGVPPLSKLGGKRWDKQKQQVAEAVRDLAKQLLRVQAARATQPGIAFPDDTAWLREFEAEFAYEETDDQLAAIAAVKNDMTQPRSMDRLICGDVGFGKTEVAIRAAFKAAEFGKQVAVLVPTTVLAEQHERTFRGRMADYPFRVVSISRFKTSQEQAEILKDLGAGRIDIIIGTHRLLSKDVAFADLGLVIIDEEQRFGVEHKNKLLQLRLTADVLTLTATPIPRTLHMSMIGLRDISSLATPPADRRAIVTEVIPFDRRRVQQALVRELSRDGQVYFLHNRVHDIQSVADEVHTMVPDARIDIGHGQMPPRKLEEVMLKFIRGKTDILVCTTIIESGIDIPTANTIIIDQADHFGLADLHQLRGRVGRYKHRAYCYLLLPGDRPVTEQAAKRLHAVEQYSMLGAGFKIAMRDLEIRGAGNLLGAEQSGHIAAVGYEMYCLLLEQEAKRLQNQPVIETSRTHLELRISGQIPKRYIASDKHRMDAYRRLVRCTGLDELRQVARDLTDAYGEPPDAAQTLIDLTEIRIAASNLGIEKIQLEGPDLIFSLSSAARLQHVFQGALGRVSLIDPQTLYYRPPATYLSQPRTLLAVLRKLLVKSV
ncbi:MAG: transcription-repair coupling factor [Phycisphaeraceae bacterium]|nr:transcription-repair coupling factor [Phycisphaeraceae bacterium]